MTDTPDFDALDIDRLRAVGSVKWSVFPEAIGMFVAEMDFGTAPAVTRALRRSVDSGLLGYLPDPVSDALSQACADWLRTAHGWDVRADRVHPVGDVLRALEIAIEFYSRPGSAVILPTPGYMPFLGLPGNKGREVLEVPLALHGGRRELDLDALDRAFRAGGQLLVLCNPHNPVGRVLSRAELLAVSEVVTRHGGRVFADEIHAPLVLPGATHIPYASLSPETAAHTVTATSASKAWNIPGLKCAQLILGSEADQAVWARIGPMAGHGASNLGVIANTVAYTEGGPWLDHVLAYLDGNRRILGDLLAEHLPGIGWAPPEGTYIAWLDGRGLGLGEHPADFFRERAGVAMTDGAACGAAGNGFMRFTFATSRPILERAVLQMAAALRSAGRSG
jgi:cystathionine beta-lyase